MKFVLESLVVRGLRGSLPQLLRQNKSEGVICSTWSHFWGVLSQLQDSQRQVSQSVLCFVVFIPSSFGITKECSYLPSAQCPFMPLSDLIPRGRCSNAASSFKVLEGFSLSPLSLTWIFGQGCVAPSFSSAWGLVRRFVSSVWFLEGSFRLLFR